MPTLPTNPHSIGDSGHVNDHNTMNTALAAAAYISGTQLTDAAGTILSGFGEWADYTPVVKQGSATPTFTKELARYIKIGKTITVNCRLAITSAGASGYVSCSLPSTPKRAIYIVVGSASVTLNAVTYNAVVYQITNTGDVFFQRGDVNPTGPLGQDPVANLKSGDVLNFTATYEVA